MGIKVLPPDVNDSDANFTTGGTDIRFGLAAIRNVGDNVVASIVATRKAKGAFADFSDFLQKVDPVACNKKVVESLIKAGAFDSLGHTRRGLLDVHAEAVDASWPPSATRRSASSTCSATTAPATRRSDTVFAVTVPVGEWDKTVLLAYEREMLGLYVSDHPLLGVEHVLAAHVGLHRRRAHGDQIGDGQQVVIGGILSSVLRQVNKTGAPWASAVLEDLEGAIEVMFFPQTYEQVAVSLAEDAVVVVKGRLDRREDVPKLIAIDVSVPDLSRGAARAGGRLAAGGPLHPAGRRAAQGGAAPPTRAPPRCTCSCQRRRHDRAADRRRAAGHPDAGADGRPQGAARPRLPGGMGPDPPVGRPAGRVDRA